MRWTKALWFRLYYFFVVLCYETIRGEILAFRVQRRFNLAALTPFIDERIAHYAAARKIMIDGGLLSEWADILIQREKNEPA